MADKEKKVAEPKNESKKPAKDKNKGKLKEAWKGFNSERKKIVWPTWKQVLKNTLVVLVVVGCCAVVIAALDIVFHEGITELPKIINKIKG